ncbi:Anti-anti-sigma regulatory factor (antagonist of anti-sigma factor) [Gulbenkiania indica]|uniref:Anti-anti-sigma regulatory factor (Antagonist of anti-sigma factor) n=1 Tax=Gulbenkiania indica TaxID=375574 RepID=A0A0K6GTL4_9NEIS|nr:STAS domain-containing protein [Gulbenkiania indica]CUA81903.1 Anti-anti-sigma regulatory factor (antagonist of anti-sigma factor) [Gulbenkiania indica]
MNTLRSLLQDAQPQLLEQWLAYQLQLPASRRGSLREGELREQSRQFLSRFIEVVGRSEGGNIREEAWAEVRDLLTALSKSRAQQGFTPTETALFVFSLKQPMFEHLSGSGEAGNDVLDRVWRLNRLLDDLGLYTTEMYQRGRESIIQKQQQELLDLSTPVVKLYDQILALPLIGTLDSERTQVVMENLLDGIIAHEARIAIIDITGVPAVDTLVAQHLMKTIAAARLMGAECILSGIRPQIAQTIVHLGVDLGDIMTKATLADALVMALQRTGHVVVRKQG